MRYKDITEQKRKEKKEQQAKKKANKVSFHRNA